MNIRELIDNSPVKKLQVTVIGICCMLNILDGFDVLAIAFAAPPIADEWAITPAALGLVFSAGLVGMALGAMFMAPLTDRIGRRAMRSPRNIRELIDNSPVKKLQVTVIGICCMLNILDGFDVLAIAFAAPIDRFRDVKSSHEFSSQSSASFIHS